MHNIDITCTNSTDGAVQMADEAIINDVYEAGVGNISSVGNTRILQDYISSKKNKKTLLVIRINLYAKKLLTLW